MRPRNHFMPCNQHNRKRPAALAFLFLAMLLVLQLTAAPAFAETAPASSVDHLLPAVGSALVEAGQQQWKEAAGDLQQFKEHWLLVKQTGSQDLADAEAQVDAALTDAESKLQAEDAGSKQALSVLAKAVNAYVNASAEQQGGSNKASGGTEAAGKLIPFAKESLAAIESKDWVKAKSSYQNIVNAWPKSETPIRSENFTVYGQLETQISLVRIALQADPVREEQAAQEMKKLLTLLTDYTEGKIQNTGSAESGSNYTLSDLLGVLETVRQQTVEGQSDKAADNMNKFIAAWPSVEGEVRISSPALYTEVENQMSEVSGYLLSSPPRDKEALALIEEMKTSLTPIAGSHSYTVWDAALVLLREGLEAILVIAALLSYLKRSGNSAGRKYIWSGAGTGFVLSIILAVVLTYTISQAASGSAREMIEGITGLVAVIMMITVGQWLHNKSNTKAWNQYVGKQVSNALAKGSLWSLFSVALLAILREGAETTIFYVGMASSIPMLQLILGVVIALVILAILGYAIIVLSASLPLRAFFLGATLLIYYLVFRFLGDSIHSLQVAGRLSAHSQSSLPSISWLGMYPTWETFIPQMIILAYIVWQILRQEVGKSKKTRISA
ncbi:FTR1 family iron permease [Paenibacillus dokdonensis]|uniref:FTR1 family iron permease n=1 Tax=Paenibacillus dokdonensis TaxID=2567944 RepID=A0ABU6GRJ3_9BACL|nr:FTR1 family protein [Paenibacillus dokdonensis]MEC0241707.1 FTR1 family iron permease [Paenibacillus dokdonensis]